MFGPGSFASSVARDVQPPGAPAITGLHQINNRYWRLTIGHPSTYADGWPLTRLVGYSVVTMLSEGANPFDGLTFAQAAALDGAQHEDFEVDLEDGDSEHDECDVPVLDVSSGKKQWFGVYRDDGDADPTAAEPSAVDSGTGSASPSGG